MTNGIVQVRFIKHTHYIVSGGKDGHIIFWDGDRGELVYQIQHHSKPVVSLRMTRLDADRIFAASRLLKAVNSKGTTSYSSVGWCGTDLDPNKRSNICP